MLFLMNWHGVVVSSTKCIVLPDLKVLFTQHGVQQFGVLEKWGDVATLPFQKKIDMP